MHEFEVLKQQLPGVRRNVPLKNHTTFRIGGAAKYFFVAKTKEDIVKAQQTARNFRLPFFILAGGSNLLVSDQGFKGLVVKIQNSKFKVRKSLLYAEAGVSLAVLVKETGKLGLSGLEWAGGLPGTVGGAVRGNAGAFTGEIKDVVLRVEALDESGKARAFSKKQCDFAYRSSIFKKRGWIILSATLRLKKGNKKLIQSIAREHMNYRKERHPLEYPNAGSIFKNCDLKKFSKKLQSELKDVVKVDPFPVIPTAYLISQAGLKGLRVGHAQVSEKHPNYMVNLGNAKSQEVLRLIKKVKRRIAEKFHVEAEEEITFVS